MEATTPPPALVKVWDMVDDQGRIIEFIIKNFNRRKITDAPTSIKMDSLNFSVCIEEKNEMIESDLNIFSIKVSCNHVQCLLEDNSSHDLKKFICEMQKQIRGSHLTIFQPNANDHERTREEWKVDDKLMINLRAFMSFSSMMKEGNSLEGYMCTLKLMNPEISLLFWMEGNNALQLNLSDRQIIRCGDYLLYAQPQNCMAWGPGNACAYGKAVFQHSESRHKTFPEYSQRKDLGNSVSCIMCFIPIHEQNDSPCFHNKRGKKVSDSQTSNFVHGQGIIQAYYKDGLPIDMTHFLAYYDVQLESLVSWSNFGMQINTKSSVCYPYSIQWSIRTRHMGAFVMQETITCTKFYLLFCFIFDEMPVDFVTNFTPAQRSNVNIIQPLQECSDFCMKLIFKEHFEKMPLRGEKLGEDMAKETSLLSDWPTSKSTNVFEYWIPDIATSLEEIFKRSTNADFRTMFGNYLPPKICTRSYVEFLLWQTIQPMGSEIKELQIPTSTLLSLGYYSEQMDSNGQDIYRKCSSPNKNHCGRKKDDNENNGSMAQRDYLSRQNITYNQYDDSVLQIGTQSSQGAFLDYMKDFNENQLNLNGFQSDNNSEIKTRITSVSHETRIEEKTNSHERRFVKKRSFEESDTSSTYDNLDTNMDDWMNLEDDLEQMKKLRLCDDEGTKDNSSLSNEICKNALPYEKSHVADDFINCKGKEPEQQEEPEELCTIRHKTHFDCDKSCNDLISNDTNERSQERTHKDVDKSHYNNAQNCDLEIYDEVNDNHCNFDFDAQNKEAERLSLLVQSREAKEDCLIEKKCKDGENDNIMGNAHYSGKVNSDSKSDDMKSDEEDWYDNKKIDDWFDSLLC